MYIKYWDSSTVTVQLRKVQYRLYSRKYDNIHLCDANLYFNEEKCRSEWSSRNDELNRLMHQLQIQYIGWDQWATSTNGQQWDQWATVRPMGNTFSQIWFFETYETNGQHPENFTHNFTIIYP